MTPTSSNRKINLLLFLLAFIGSLIALTSCDGASTDIKDRIKSEVQDLQDKLKQELETGLPQTDIQLSPPIATMQGIQVGYSPRISYSLFVYLKPTSIAVANKQYTADLYEKGVFRQSESVSWNQPELNVLKEKAVEFISNRQEFEAYISEDIGHIFGVKVHE